MVLALYHFSDDLLSMYRVLFNSLLYFQRYDTDKLNVEKRKGSNSVNTEDGRGYGSYILQFPSWHPISVSSFI